MTIIYEIWGESAAGPGLTEGHISAYGHSADQGEAEAEMARWHQRNVVERAYTKRFWIKEIDTTGMFQIPPKPTPRERYSQRWEAAPSRPGCWETTEVQILDALHDEGTIENAPAYKRDYPRRPPFEPFRQGDRDYALISRHYQATDVIDLATGKVIASEDRKADGWGHCPVGFYVPDWWDVHDGSSLPGTAHWKDSYEWPDGTAGFVWGCHWGDDNGWKVQFLDLSRITEGVLVREERFGYLYLDTRGDPQDFISVWPGEGSHGPRVTFSVPRRYEVAGKLLDDGTDTMWATE